MSTTKYIINSGTQSISGSLNIQGELKINDTGKYRALLTQTETIVGNIIDNFNTGLIIGERYTITSYGSGDDFSNIAQVISGTINETGCVFVATGETPNIWSNSSQLTSFGDLVVDVLENTLGYDLTWVQAPFGGYGYYVAFRDNNGPFLNQFPRSKTDIKVGVKYPFDFFPPMSGLTPIGVAGVGNAIAKDSHIFIEMYYDGDISNNALYYTPVEITINQDLDTTPINVYGENVAAFPYGNVSVNVLSGDNYAETFSANINVVVNNMEEMISALNSDTGTNFLGVYSLNPDVDGGVILTIATNLVNQLSPDGVLTFEVFND